jgi:hypothetical protein
MDWLLNFLMGQTIDAPITVWEEMFLPSEIGARIEDFQYRDPSGAERSLVARREVLNRARNRPPVLDAPRNQWPRELAAGLAGAGLLVLPGALLKKKRPALYRGIMGLSQSALGLFFGAAGSMLFFMTFFTNHDYTYNNSTILYINPLLLAAVPLGGIFGCGGPGKKRFFAEQLLQALWTYVLFGCILSIVIKLFPGFYQQNQGTQALVLPFAFILSFIPQWIERGLKRGVRMN